jgi:tetratricopeptide (TPR) repeat protein
MASATVCASPSAPNVLQLRRRAEKLAAKGRWGEEAAIINAHIIKIDLRDIEAWNRLAECYLVMGKLDLAIQMFQRVLTMESQNWVAQLMLGIAERRLSLRKAAKNSTGFSEAFQRGVKERRNGNVELALASLERAHEIRPDNIACKVALAATHRQLKRPVLAAAIHRSVLADGFSEAAQVGLAGALRDRVQLNEAERLDREVLDRHPQDGYASNGLMGILADKRRLRP